MPNIFDFSSSSEYDTNDHFDIYIIQLKKKVRIKKIIIF
jgi:hypothetical protein